MKRILLCGLPGSGKTTLAKRLVETLGNADWYNADSVREQFQDWDFSPEGRARQMKRMQDFTRKSVAKGRYGIADFVCPTQALRDEFRGDYVIWMNTIKEGRFEDTNKMFEIIDEKRDYDDGEKRDEKDDEKDDERNNYDRPPKHMRKHEKHNHDHQCSNH